jgi:5-formyltetrahydrofolate cyclo-ligase
VLRQSIINARSKVGEAERAKLSTAITARLTQLNAYRTAHKVLGYLNFGAEYAAELLVQQALGDGKQVWLPKVNRMTNELDVYRVKDLQRDVAPGAWDIREPLVERCEKLENLAEIEWMLLPGVAFTRDGARLGYGGGYYDKLLARMMHQPELAAGAFALQVVTEIPQESTDRKVDSLVTEHETMACST